MKVFLLPPHYELEIHHQSDTAFRIRLRYDDKVKISKEYLGDIDAHFLKEPSLEGSYPHWDLIFYDLSDHPGKYPLPDISPLFNFLEENGFVQKPATFYFRRLMPFDNTIDQRKQFGRVFSGDPDSKL